MSAAIAGTSVISLDAVAVIVVASMVVGTVDLLRQPGWAWRRAGENKAAYCILVALVPLVGLAMYLRAARPQVNAIVVAGRAASLPFEGFNEDADEAAAHPRPAGPVTGPARFAVIGATTVEQGQIRLVDPDPAGRTPAAAVGTAPRSTLARERVATGYRPVQRTSLPVGPPAAQPAGSPSGRVPAGWKADPTGRHQFRYWGGSHWTDNVADDGEQSRDAPASRRDG